MTAEEALEALDGKKILRHKLQIFFLTADKAEADHYLALGFGLIEYQPRRWSQPQAVHYEVHVNRLLDTLQVDDVFGETKVDHVERDRLLAMLRLRDGVAFECQR